MVMLNLNQLIQLNLCSFLSSIGRGDAYDKIIYPGIKEALIATMLAAQVQIDVFKQGFEFFGADFMLTQDLR